MNIKDDFEINDHVTGLKIKVIPGKFGLDRLHIEIVGKPAVHNRDFFFTRDGEFDGTGSSLEEGCAAIS